MFNVCVSGAEADVIAGALVNLSRKTSVSNSDKFLRNERTFIPRPLTLNGNSDWVSTIKCLSPPISVELLWSPAPVPDVGSPKHVAFYGNATFLAGSCEPVLNSDQLPFHMGPTDSLYPPDMVFPSSFV